MLYIKRGTLDDLERIYPFYVQDFPRSERKSYRILKNLMNRNIGELQILYDDKIWVGYAFLIKQNNQSVVLLDYLAIRDGMRNRGYGEVLIVKLKDCYNCYEALFGEVESLEDGLSESMYQQRARRLRFYERLGFELINDYVIKLWNVSYIPVYVTTKKKIPQQKMISYIKSFYDLFYGSHFKTEEDYHRYVSFCHK